MLRRVPTYVYMSSTQGELPISTNVEQAKIEALFIRSKLLAEGDKCVVFRDVDGNISKVDPTSGLGIFVFTSSVTGKVHKFEARDWKSAEIELRKVEEVHGDGLDGYVVDTSLPPCFNHPVSPGGGQSDCDNPVVDADKPEAGIFHRASVTMSRRRRGRKNSAGRLRVHTSRL
ncbi:MAG: hypothetical protein WC551_02870 [Patescibacteria group bacterium]